MKSCQWKSAGYTAQGLYGVGLSYMIWMVSTTPLTLTFITRVGPFHVKWYARAKDERSRWILHSILVLQRIRHMSAGSVHVRVREQLYDAVYNLSDLRYQDLDNRYEQPSSRFHSCSGRDCPWGFQQGEQKRPLDISHCMGKICHVGFQASKNKRKKQQQMWWWERHHVLIRWPTKNPWVAPHDKTHYLCSGHFTKFKVQEVALNSFARVIPVLHYWSLLNRVQVITWPSNLGCRYLANDAPLLVPFFCSFVRCNLWGYILV